MTRFELRCGVCRLHDLNVGGTGIAPLVGFLFQGDDGSLSFVLEPRRDGIRRGQVTTRRQGRPPRPDETTLFAERVRLPSERQARVKGESTIPVEDDGIRARCRNSHRVKGPLEFLQFEVERIQRLGLERVIFLPEP